jgi:ABC-type phosphate/phosphonate transport system substrate-binding protein
LREINGIVGEVYYSQIYTSKRSAIHHNFPEKACERIMAFGSPDSTSNFLIPALLLANKGLHPFASFQRVEFTGGHELAAKAVYEGRADLGAGHDGVIHDLAQQYRYGDAEDKPVQVARSDMIPSDPVVANIPDAKLREIVQSALMTVGASESGKGALDIFWGKAKGLAGTTSDKYAGLVLALKQLNLSREDLLREKT